MWNSKPDKIKHSYIIACTKDGGLGLTHLSSQFFALKCAWIKRLLLDTEVKWRHNILRQLPCQDRFLWECYFHTEDVKGIFHKVKSESSCEVLKGWSMFNFSNLKI